MLPTSRSSSCHKRSGHPHVPEKILPVTTGGVLVLINSCIRSCRIVIPFRTLLVINRDIRTIYPSGDTKRAIHATVRSFRNSRACDRGPNRLFTLGFSFTGIGTTSCSTLLIPNNHTPRCLQLGRGILRLIQSFSRTNGPVTTIYRNTRLLTTTNVLRNHRYDTCPTYTPRIQLTKNAFVSVTIASTRIRNGLTATPT